LITRARILLLLLALIPLGSYAQKARVLPIFDQQHVQHHYIQQGYSGFALDSVMMLAREKFTRQINERPVYHPFGDERDTRAARGVNVFDCDDDNWGFEQGNLNGWSTTGNVDVINAGSDPYGNFPWVFPGGGNTSIKVSGDEDSEMNGSISREIQVPPTGITYFSFHFAMCIFNFPHYANEAAKFKVRLYDQNGVELTCPSYTCFFSTDLGPQGVDSFEETSQPAQFYNPNADGDTSNNSTVTYSDWTSVNLDLSGYAGQTLTIEFRVDWCIYGPDWAYALVDVDCPVNTSQPNLYCSSPPFYPVCGPEGMASYTWTNESGTVIGNNECVDVLSPGIFTCTFIPQNVQCTTGSAVTTQYTVAPIPTALSTSELDACANEPINFTSNSTVDVGTIQSYWWDFDDGTQSSAANTVHAFNSNGTYDVSLITTTDQGCRDTSYLEVFIIPAPVPTFSWTTNCDDYGLAFTGSATSSNSTIALFEWDIYDDGSTESTGTTTSFLFPSAGTFDVSLTAFDQNNCYGSVIIAVDVLEFVDLTVDASDYNGFNIDCFGNANGFIEFIGTGGDGNYTYFDENGSLPSTTLNNLGPGEHFAIVEDGRGCRDTLVVEITEPPLLEATVEVTSDYNGFNVSCFDISDGIASASPIGGVMPYSFLWNNISGNANSGPILPSGANDLIVTDANGCDVALNMNLTNPTPVEIFQEDISNYFGYNVTCFNGSDGWIDIGASGGVGNYQFTNSDVQASGYSSGLAQGTYTLTVEDANGCEISDDFNLVSPDPISCNVEITSDYNGADVSCFNAQDATATSNPSGGVGPYTHLWANGAVGNSASLLGVVHDWVEVTDYYGCTQICDFTIQQPDPLQASIINLPDTCDRIVGAFESSPYGGTGPYSIDWRLEDTGQVFSGMNVYEIPEGNYQITLTDANGCAWYSNASKGEVPATTLAILGPKRSCSMEDIPFAAASSQLIHEYNWNFNDEYTSSEPAPAALFTKEGEVFIALSVIDEHQCFADTSLTLQLLPGLTFYIPNTFTPNNDGINDVFGPEFQGLTEYSCYIVDRWGITVFQSNDPYEKWQGDMQDSGYYNVNDIFNYIIKTTGHCQLEQTHKGQVLLLR
jgi:gliding motility-associated-like protein